MTNHTPSVAAASGAAALVRSLADTVAGDGTDLLATRDDAVAWLQSARLFADDDLLTGSEHNALLRLRDGLRDVLAARAVGRPNEDAGARLTRALADGRLVVAVNASGTATLASSARATYSNLVAAIAIAVAEVFRG